MSSLLAKFYLGQLPASRQAAAGGTDDVDGNLPMTGCPFLLLITLVSSLLESVWSIAISRTKASSTSATGSTSSQQLPWQTSVAPSRTLTYMPMLQAQLDLIRSLGLEEVAVEEKFICRTSSTKPARIGNLEFRGERFRKVRMTYFDGGDAVQVFNTLWYPSYEYDAPLFGVDLISLGLQRILAVIDFQPLHPTTDYSAKYIDHLHSARSKYPDLHGVLSGKIYDDTSFFSKQMLFGRFTDESKILPVVLPAFQEYLLNYVRMVSSLSPNNDADAMATVLSRQRSYDEYSALKDPAVGLFDAYFGKEWSHDFVHQFLFCLSRAESEVKPVHNFQLDSKGHVAVTGRGHTNDSTSLSR